MNDRNTTSAAAMDRDYRPPTDGMNAGDEALAPALGIDPQSMATPASQSNGSATGLLAHDTADSFRERWTAIQAGFVDEPKDAVRLADGLVSDVIQELSQRFSSERQGLESQWDGGSEVSTEDLRMALRHYRDFFQRLLAA